MPETPTQPGACPVAVIVAAAGRGERMGGPVRKPFLELDGRPILQHTLARFVGVPGLGRLVLAVHAEDAGRVDDEWGEELRVRLPSVRVVAGGDTRTETIWNALGAVDEEPGQVILIHDGVRPFVERSVILGVIEAARETGAAIAAVPVVATVKRVGDDSLIEQTVPRESIWLAQTPQGFRREVILEAYEAARREGLAATDDAALVEHIGRPVRVVPDRRDNIKITTPEDLAVAEAILRWKTRQG
jgi:2-C-methyl-D-erythritol 4-phosphate cytidylyltransferase